MYKRQALQTDTKPDGPVVAAFIAAGIASLVMGIGVVLNEASPTIKTATGIDVSAFLAFDKNFGLGSGVGALSGKVGLAVIAFVVSWVLLHLWLRGKEVNFRTGFIVVIAKALVSQPGAWRSPHGSCSSASGSDG